MGWSIGFDDNWNRDIGYGVPCKCDHPGCEKNIDRGLSYVCGGEPYGGEDGCGLFFCEAHFGVDDKSHQVCERCASGQEPFEAKADVAEWIEHKLRCPTWQQWRDENPEAVASLKANVASSKARKG